MKKYTVEFNLSDDGGLKVDSENDGFTAFEIIGLMAWKQKDLENQIFGEIRPDVVTRKVITD